MLAPETPITVSIQKPNSNVAQPATMTVADLQGLLESGKATKVEDVTENDTTETDDNVADNEAALREDKKNPKKPDEPQGGVGGATVAVEEQAAEQGAHGAARQASAAPGATTEVSDVEGEQGAQGVDGGVRMDEQGMPIDGEGRVLYEQVPVAQTIRNLYEDNGLTREQADEFVAMFYEQAQKELSAVEKKKPAVKNFKNGVGAFKAAQAQWQKARDAAQAKVDYWQAVEDSVKAAQETTTEAQTNGVQAQTETVATQATTTEANDVAREDAVQPTQTEAQVQTTKKLRRNFNERYEQIVQFYGYKISDIISERYPDALIIPVTDSKRAKSNAAHDAAKKDPDIQRLEQQKAEALDRLDVQFSEALKKEEAQAEQIEDSVVMPSSLHWSSERASNGEPFLENEQGEIDLFRLSQDQREKMGISDIPFRLTPSMVAHVYERHGKELKLKSPEDAVKAILDVMKNADHIRAGRDNTFVFSVEGTRTLSARKAITFILEYDKGNWLGIKTMGYDSVDRLKELSTIWVKGEVLSSTASVAPANVTSAQSKQGDMKAGIASNQIEDNSADKVTTSSAQKQTGDETANAEPVAKEAQPKAAKKKQTKKKPIDLYKFVLRDKKSQRNELNGVYYKDGYAYASDGYVLIKLKMKYPAKYEGKIIDKDGNVIEGNYPNAEDVLQIEYITSNHAPIAVSDMAERIKGALAFDKIVRQLRVRDANSYGPPVGHVRLGDMLVEATLFEMFLDGAEYIGIEQFSLPSSPARAIISRTENGAVAVMPVKGDDKGFDYDTYFNMATGFVHLSEWSRNKLYDVYGTHDVIKQKLSDIASILDNYQDNKNHPEYKRLYKEQKDLQAALDLLLSTISNGVFGRAQFVGDMFNEDGTPKGEQAQRGASVDSSPRATERQARAIASQLQRLGLGGKVRLVRGVKALYDAAKARLQAVFHGSGADFNAFDFSFMGTGEGAQAYGWGGYVTEVEGIGKAYAESSAVDREWETLNRRMSGITYDLQEHKRLLEYAENDLELSNRNLTLARGKHYRAIQNSKKALSEFGEQSQQYKDSVVVVEKASLMLANEVARRDSRKEQLSYYKQKVKDAEEQKAKVQRLIDNYKPKTKNLYHVEIPTDNGSNYLVWEKPLGGELADDLMQEVMAALTREMENDTEFWNDEMYRDLTPKQIGDPLEFWMTEKDRSGVIFGGEQTMEQAYQSLKTFFGSDKAASEFLSEQGYVGISYPAEHQSGGRKDGARNYVIFKESDMKITDHIRFAQDEQGEIAGATLPNGDVILNSEAMRLDTPFHEFAHKLFTYAQENPQAANLYAAIRQYAENAPQAVKDYVKQHYPNLQGDAYLDEVFAWALSRQSEGGLEAFLKSRGIALNDSEAQAWYEQVWNLIKQLWAEVRPVISNVLGKRYADLGVFDAYEAMSVEDTGKALFDLMMGGRALKPSVPGMVSEQGVLERRGQNTAREAEAARKAEEQAIEREAKANGTWLKAPNGKDSHLSPKQWVQVRTKAFKDWFGDWELANLYNHAVKAWNDKNAKDKSVFNVSDRAKTRFNELLGTDINQLVITNDEIRHTKNKHGQGEEKRGQKNITPEDILLIPYLVNNFDSMELSPKHDRAGNRAIEIRKRINGVSIVGTIEQGPNKESFVTNYHKSYALDASRETPGLNVRNGYDFANVQQEIENIKKSALNASKVVDENGEPLVVDNLFLKLNSTKEIDACNRKISAAKSLLAECKQAEEITGIKYGSGNRNFYYTEAGSDFFDSYGQYSYSVQELFEALHKGSDLTLSVCFRYGAIKDDFRSYNYRDKIAEKGVSVVGHVSELNLDRSFYYEAFFGNNPYNVVIGVETGEKGADGEILLTPAYVLSEQKDIAKIAKSATDNVGSFSEANPDIRFQFVGELFDDEGRPREDVRFRRGGFENNRGYTQREDGSRISKRASWAEEEGSFTAGKFCTEYGVSRSAFKALVDLGIIKNTAWHHTGANFKKSDFYEWADGADLDADYSKDRFPDGSMAAFYKEHKKEIDRLAKDADGKEWAYRHKRTEVYVPSRKEFVKDEMRGNWKRYLSDEERAAVEAEHRAISNETALTSRSRYEMHTEVDERYRSMAESRYMNEHDVDKEIAEKWDRNIKAAAERAQHNATVDDYNAQTDGKEKVLLRLGELFGIEDLESEVEHISQREQVRIEGEQRRAADEARMAEKKNAEKALGEWVAEQVKQGKAVEHSRIPLSNTPTDRFVETKREMNGKFGWFNASSRYNLPEYVSGYEFTDEAAWNEYQQKKGEIAQREDLRFKRTYKKAPADNSTGAVSNETALRTNHRGTVIPFEDTANIQKNLDNLISQTEKVKAKAYISELGKAFELTDIRGVSQYGTFVAKNGVKFRLRISDHNATVSNFDDEGHDYGISIVVARLSDKLKENGNADVQEFFYSTYKLDKTPGNHLADIAKSLKQTLYSGEYKDETIFKDENADNTRRRFIGEVGAANLDKAEEATTRLDNLGVARDMEAAGKDAKTIKRATGWERGVDKKWRYEVSDMEFEYVPKGNANTKAMIEKQPWYAEFKSYTDRVFAGETLTEEESRRLDRLSEYYDNISGREPMYLNDYVSDNTLFKEYPQLKSVKVEFYHDPNTMVGGSFYSNERYGYDLIRINLANIEDTDSVLLHEIQHAIQHYEGFARGGNRNTYSDVYNGLSDKAEVWRLRKEFDDKSKELGDDARQINVYNAVLKDYREAGIEFGDGLLPSREVFDKGFNLWARGYDNEGYEDAYNNYHALYDKYGVPDPFNNKYKELAGEVESRNVQSRMGMSAEERLNSLASETEDVAREDQIIIENYLQEAAGMGAASMSEADNESATASTMAAKRETAERLSRQLGVRVQIEDAGKGRNRRYADAKGWYDVKTGTVHLILGNHEDAADVERSILHEVVGHRIGGFVKKSVPSDE